MINIQPVTAGSETHNKREREFKHVNKDLIHMNESLELNSIKAQLAEVKVKYTATTGQKMQKKATPIREGVVLITPENTMEDLKQLASRLEDRFSIRTFQIHIHRDEGHNRSVDSRNEEWKPNLHAHMVFDWTDSTTGKSLKLDKKDMSEMQDIVTDILNDPYRGVSSDREHLTALQFKNLQEEKLAARLQKEKKELIRMNNELKEHLHISKQKEQSLVKQVEQARNDFKALRETIVSSKDVVIKKNALGIIDTEETLKRATAVIEHRAELLEQNKRLSSDLMSVIDSNDRLMQKQQIVPDLEKQITVLEKKLELAIASTHLTKNGKGMYKFVADELKVPGRIEAIEKNFLKATTKSAGNSLRGSGGSNQEEEQIKRKNKGMSR